MSDYGANTGDFDSDFRAAVSDYASDFCDYPGDYGRHAPRTTRAAVPGNTACRCDGQERLPRSFAGSRQGGGARA